MYAIGDVHGEGDLLRQALRLIRTDNAARRDATVTIVFLGDIIDRGSEAAGLLRTLARMSTENVVMLKGNHEAALAAAYRGDHEVLKDWLPFGAIATLTGFGITPEQTAAAPAILGAVLRARIDPELIDWLDGLPCAWECGDYYFTHAGVRPGVKLHKQEEHDLLWIREPFLSSRRWHGKIVVHGHTIEAGVPALGGNRIGVDTGAHEHGVLTVLGLEGGRQWLLQSIADQPEDAVSEGPASPDRAPAQDVDALIASIITPELEPPDTALLLESPSQTIPEMGSSSGRAKGLGKSGIAAAGFALVLAAVGGALALGLWSSPTGTGNVTFPIPDMASGELPQGAATVATSSAKYRAGNRNRMRGWTSRRQAGTNPADGAVPKLSGAALDRALEEDRAVTRRLNQDELSRQKSLPAEPK